MTSTPTLLDVLASLFWMGLTILLLRLWTRSNVPRYFTTHAHTLTPSIQPPLLSTAPDVAPQPTATTQPRMLIAYADNPSDHPYDELTLDNLYPHLYDDHFELWNRCGETGVPSRLRREHAGDHGLVIR